MLIPLGSLVSKYNITPGNVLHVGAHVGEEADVYDSLGFKSVYWVEADPNTAIRLKKNVEYRPGHHVIVAVCSDEVSMVTFHRANNGESSSILELGTHLKEHPEVHYVGEREVIATTVDSLLELDMIGRCEFLNLDVQGAELLVLKGALEFLSTVEYIYAEVNERELYRGGVLMKDLDLWLSRRGFDRLETKISPHHWGDALYIRKDIL